MNPATLEAIELFEQEMTVLRIKYPIHCGTNQDYMDEWFPLLDILRPVEHLIPLEVQEELEVSHWLSDAYYDVE